jgi:small conductance mechanosensitive channel
METLQRILDIQAVTEWVVLFIPKLIVAVLIMIAFFAAYRITRRPLGAILERAGFDRVLVTLLVENIYRFALIIFGLVMAASQLGVNVGAALAGIGVVGIAIGFAAQDALANTIAGFMIFWDKPFRVGEWVTVRDQYGEVRDITLRSTRIRTNQNTYVVIPNKHVIDEVLVNHSHHGETRVDVPVGIAYKEDIVAAREVLLDAVKGLPEVAANPEPSVVVEELGASSVDLLVRVWIEDAGDEQPVLYAVMEASKRALDAAGIQIPFHHLQLFVDQVEDRVWESMARLPQWRRAQG